jgi:translation initiation factor 2B subunit (eIF-2B alpha/beta/delta family)
MFNVAKEGATTHGHMGHWHTNFFTKEEEDENDQCNHSKMVLEHHAKLVLTIKRSKTMVTFFQSNRKSERNKPKN